MALYLVRTSPTYTHEETDHMSDLDTTTDQIYERFAPEIEGLAREDIHERLDTLVNEYRVPLDEATRSVTSAYAEEAGIDQDSVGGEENELRPVGDIEEDEAWIDVEVTVTDLWEPRSESIAQVGLVGDASGTSKFVSFSTSDLPELEEGASYRLSNVVTDEYQGDYSIKLNRTTIITELEESVEVGDDSTTVEGALIDIQSGSGLIKRCPEEDCTRVLQNGRCSEHGEGEGEFDLRIKGVLDDGKEVQELIFDQEATERLTEITLEQAKEMAMDALDTSVVSEEIRAEVLGSYYRVTGPTFGRYVLANETEELAEPVDVESTLIRARSL
jgi:replication factor A1